MTKPSSATTNCSNHGGPAPSRSCAATGGASGQAKPADGNIDDPTMVSFALGYAKRGLKVFPCYEPIYGVCTCGNPDCGSPGKHPRTEHGVKDASADPAQIRKWWTEWPLANIGISCEGLIVIDVDAGKQGFVSLEKLETEFGKLPDTWTADTGGGGQHYFYRRNGHSVKNGVALRPGVDLRTNGGYVIAAPSIHVTGKRYAWSSESARNLAEFPADWIPLFDTGTSSGKERFDTAAALAGVPEGQRDVAVWKLACKLRNADVPIAEAVELVLKAAGSCKPPFPADQAREKVERAYRTYQPKQAEPGSAGIVRNIAAEVKEYVAALEGSFSTQQLYSDLTITNSADKTAARVALHRMRGTLIEPDGIRAGWYRPIQSSCLEMDLSGDDPEECDLWLPLDLSNYVRIMAGNIILVTGDADSGKTAFLLNIILYNLRKWDCFYFNSEMGREELKLRLRLFENFPLKHQHFHPFERSADFADVIRSGKNCLNIIDYLEVSENFYLVSKYLNDIHRKLGQAIAVVALQKRDRNSPMPIGKERALEKPRLAIALSHGHQGKPNQATILKAKNRKVEHSLIMKTRPYKLIQGSKFISDSPGWF